MTTFNLFVYGTLMRGFRSNRLIPNCSKVEKGKITGNLYHYVAGYPIVQVAKPHNYAEGSLDYDKDLAVQEDRNRVIPECLPFDIKYGRVYGELYEIPYDGDWTFLKAIDRYEGFNESQLTSLYKRTLIPVQTGKGILWAWVYNMDEIPTACCHVLSGDWTDCFYSNHGGLRPELSKISIDASYTF